VGEVDRGGEKAFVDFSGERPEIVDRPRRQDHVTLRVLGKLRGAIATTSSSEVKPPEWPLDKGFVGRSI
jgi:hypothetical protein